MPFQAGNIADRMERRFIWRLVTQEKFRDQVGQELRERNITWKP